MSVPPMVFPAPSERPPAKLIDTAVAGPVTTAWNDSNSFLAAKSWMWLDAPAGTEASGRTLADEGEVQSCAAGAALAERAVRASAAERNKVGPPRMVARRSCGSFF